nr:ABC transporter ATP-binding protein [Pseudoflavonifractor phocaeensis]
MGVPFFGAVGVAKTLGENIPLSYGAITALCVGCGAARGGLRYLEQYGNHYIAFRLLAVLRDKIFTKLRTLCPARLENRQKGSLLTMITADIETLEVFYAHTVSPVCIAVLVSLAVMVVTGLAASWYLSLIAAGAYLCIGVLLPRVFSRRMAETGMRYRRELADFGAYFLDSIKGIRELVLYSAGEARAAEVDRRSDAMLGRTKALKRETAISTAATETAVSLAVLAVLTVGIFLVRGGSLSVGRMVLGVTAVFGSFGPVIAVSALPANLNQTFASGERILSLLEEKPEVEAVERGTELSYEGLEVHDLSFAYGGEAVLRGVSMTARKNEIVGIVGESGCGKSTLLKLLLRFWERSGGQIRYNGTDIDEINTESLYQNVAMVSQSTYLFDATIAENLRVAKPDATDEELMEALRMASAEELVQALPEGLSTPAGLLGGRLSMGERQRIGLARAFLSGCPLILLDEPTSNVDSINEGVILRALLKHKQGRTIILVSHRASTMAVADRVYKMENGQMEEQAI